MKQFDLWQSQVIFLNTNSDNKEKFIKQLIYQQSQKHPEKFYGEVPCVCYRLNYVAPFNEFKELRNLIMRIKENTGLRSEFRGVVAINIDEWIGHEKDDYFTIFLKYLHDHSSYIQYIFYSHENKKLQDMMSETIKVLTISYQSIDETKDMDKLYKIVKYRFKCQHKDVSLEDVTYLTDELFNKHIDLYNENILDSIILDMIKSMDGDILNKDMIQQYFNNQHTLVNMIGER